MKLIHYIAGISFLSTFAVASCSHEELMETGEGSVRLSVVEGFVGRGASYFGKRLPGAYIQWRNIGAEVFGYG